MYVILSYWKTQETGDPEIRFFDDDAHAFKHALNAEGEYIRVWKIDKGNEFPPNEPKEIASNVWTPPIEDIQDCSDVTPSTEVLDAAIEARTWLGSWLSDVQGDSRPEDAKFYVYERSLFKRLTAALMPYRPIE